MDLMNVVEFELQKQIMIKEGEAKICGQNIKNDTSKTILSLCKTGKKGKRRKKIRKKLEDIRLRYEKKSKNRKKIGKY